MLGQPPRSTLFPYTRSSDLAKYGALALAIATTVKLARALWIVPLALGTAAAKHQHARIRCGAEDRKSTRLNSSHVKISYAVFCLKKKTSTSQPYCAADYAPA